MGEAIAVRRRGGMEQEGAAAQAVTGYQIADLIISLGEQTVMRGGCQVSLPKLSFDLLVTLAEAAPNFVSFDQLMARVWPGLVIAPETIEGGPARNQARAGGGRGGDVLLREHAPVPSERRKN